jgi:hypothetical protein
MFLLLENGDSCRGHGTAQAFASGNQSRQVDAARAVGNHGFKKNGDIAAQQRQFEVLAMPPIKVNDCL